jgi:hypothetical protein
MERTGKFAIRLKADYSDEFKVEAIKVLDCSVITPERFLDGICGIDSETEYYFGTNEFLTFGDLSLSVKILTDEEASLVCRVLNTDLFGTGSGIIDQLIEEILENE